MAEYRIVAKVDPQTGAGSQKVKQDLRGIQTEAKATEAALNRSFDQAKFDKTIGGLVNRIDQLDNKLSGASSSAAAAGKKFDATTGSIERMTAAEFRAAGGAEGLAKQFNGASASTAKLEGSLRRVLAATDAEALEQMKMNGLLVDAKKLLDAGMISQERYAQVQALTAKQGQALNVVTGSQRIGMQQLGFQLGDVATMYSLGAKPAQIFGSQIGQVSQALMLMGGKDGSVLSKVAGFLGGPWGIALTVGTILLGPFIGKLFESNDALGEQMQKLKEDAEASDLTRQAHERWSHTLDGLIERQGKLADAMRDRLKVQGLTDQSDLQQAQHDQDVLKHQIQQQQQHLADLRKSLATASAGAGAAAGGGTAAGTASFAQSQQVAAIQAQIKDAQTELDRLQRAAGDATTRIVAGQILVGEQQGKAMVDLATEASQWGDRYQAALRGIFQSNEKLRAQAPQVSAGYEIVRSAMDKAASAGVNFSSSETKAKNLGVALKDGKITVTGYRTEMAKLADTLNKAAEAAEKAKRQTSDGVATFVSARQAIGIAGRELQQAGLHVSENSQFGGVTPGVHKGAGHGDDRAIDVNSGSGVTEANVPDIRAQFDAMAKRYAARGYIVLWNGNRYDPSGKITSIPAGQNQHVDHMHVEAPGTIVGKATQASTEAQAQREEREGQTSAQKAAAVLVEKGDFVSSILDQQATRGLDAGAESLDARMAKIIGDYKRKFNTDIMPEADQKKIRDALIGGDAREVQKGFDDAYTEPLKRLMALEGKTGLDRAVMNAELEKTKELHRELTPIEKETIENGIRHGDQLSREAQLLEQIRGPLDDYKNTLEALNALLAKGTINQTSYNARVAELANTVTQKSLQGLSGYDRTTGQSYADQAAISDENARYAAQLTALDEFRQTKQKSEEYYNALELAAKQQHADNLAKIDDKRREVALSAAGSIADSLLQIAETAAGKQSDVYRALFAVSKAFAIAQASLALYQNIAEAMKYGFPQNLPFIAAAAAQGAAIVSAVSSISANFASGGYVTGPGGPRDDRVPANLSNGEFVVNAKATAGNRALLEAVNAGRSVRTRQVSSGDSGSGGQRPFTLRIDATAAPGVEFEPTEMTEDRVEVIARRVVARDAPKHVAAHLQNPSSRVSKSLSSVTTAKRKRA